MYKTKSIIEMYINVGKPHMFSC